MGAAVVNRLTFWGSALSTSDILHLVQVSVEGPIGTWTPTGTTTCTDGSVVKSITAHAGKSAPPGMTAFHFNIPLTPGEYLLCYQVGGASGPLIAVQPEEGFGHDNPITVVDPGLYTELQQLPSLALAMKDMPQFGIAGLAGLAPVGRTGAPASDKFYYLASTGTCGDTPPVGLSSLTGVVDTFYESAPITNTAVFSSLGAGTYIACYFRSQSQDSVPVAGAPPALPVPTAPGWFQVPILNLDSSVTVHAYAKSNPATQLALPGAGCATQFPSPITPGLAFQVTVQVRDGSGNKIAAQTSMPVEITASVASGTFSFRNDGGICAAVTAPTYAIAASNPTIHTTTGEATFLFTITSGCTSGPCQITFTGIDPVVGALSLTGGPCTLNIAASTGLASFGFQGTAPTCYVGEACVFTVLGLEADDTLAYTVSQSVTVATSAHTGVEFNVNSVGPTGSGPWTVSMVNGVLALSLLPTPSATAASWTEATPSYTVTLTITGTVTTQLVVTLMRPAFAGLRIRDVTLCNWDGSEPNDIETNMMPSWEPSTTFPKFWDPTATVHSLSSKSVYPMIAGQYYKATVTAVDSRGVPIPSSVFFTATDTVQMLFQAAATSTNAVIGAPPSAAVARHYSTPFAPVAMTSVTQGIVFRVKHAMNCTSGVGCKLLFIVRGLSPVTPTFLETVVRSRAVKLRVECGPASVVGSTPTSLSATCPTPIAVEKGVSLRITAVDNFGNIDQFFHGKIFATCAQQLSNARMVATTVTALVARTNWTSVTASDGIAIINDFTLSTPCPNGCTINFYSDWGAGYASLPLTVKPSTVAMTTFLNTTGRNYYLLNSDRTKVAETYAKGSKLGLLLVYPDTELCFTVSAVSASQTVTLYESIWVHYGIYSPSGAAVSVVPSASTPYRSRYMTGSRVGFCFTVDGPDGADFVLSFVPQKFRDNWAATAAWSSQPITLMHRKLIGGLQIKSVSGTGLTAMTGRAAPAVNPWYRKRLTTTTDTTAITVGVNLLDHYGNVLPSNAVAAVHIGYGLTLGGCLPDDMLLDTCRMPAGVGARHAIEVQTPHTLEEGGMLRVVRLSSNYLVANGNLAVTLLVSQWCLKCDIVFSVAGGTPKTQLVHTGGPVQAFLSLSMLIPAGTPKYVAFRAGNSPFKPPASTRDGLTSGSYWRHFVVSPGARPATYADQPVLVHANCFAAGQCKETDGVTDALVPDDLFLRTTCRHATTTVLTGNGGDSMRFFVVHSTTALLYGEPSCYLNLCMPYDPNPAVFTVQAQVDIFNGYAISVSVGTQQLNCVTSPCDATGSGTGQGTTTVTRSTVAAGATEEAALFAAAAADFSFVSFKLEGKLPSDYYGQDAATGRVPSGTTPTMAGALSVSAPGATTLTSLSGVGADVGTYLLVWRGPQPVTHGVVLDVAVGDCTDTATYNYHADPSSSAYTGYLEKATLTNLKFNYTSATMQINQPFPLTVELRDAYGRWSPNAAGTLLVEQHGVGGCNDGGTLTVTGGSTVTMTYGRATAWVAFSAPCEKCTLRFTLTPSASQPNIYGLMNTDTLRRQIISKPFRVVNTLPGGASTVYATTDRTTQSATVTTSTLITVSVTTYANQGSLAIPDATPAVTVWAYNQVRSSLKTGMWTVGNGGLLRPDTTSVNLDDRHLTKTVSGTGTATLSFAFQRTCSGCVVVIAWHIPSTGAKGSFALRNAQSTSFTVTAPTEIVAFFGHTPRHVRKNTPFTAAVWTAYRDAVFPFCGFDADAVPPAAPQTPTKTATDSSNGDGANFHWTRNLTDGHVVYHMSLSAACDECNIAIGPLSLSVLSSTTATHYRVEALSPRVVPWASIGSTNVQVSGYAADDEGFVDITAGGAARCEFFDYFMCDQTALSPLLAASADGVTANNFAPQMSFMHVGGSSTPAASPAFALIPSGTFNVHNGELVATATFQVANRPVTYCVPILTDALGRTSAGHSDVGFSVDIGTANLYLRNDKPEWTVLVFEEFDITVGFAKDIGGTQFVASSPVNTIQMGMSGECPVRMLGDDSSVFRRLKRGIAKFRFVFTRRSVGGSCTFTFTSVTGHGTGNAPCNNALGACVSTARVAALPREATSWNFKVPTAFENDGPTPGPIYAVAGRGMLLRPQLYEITGASVLEAAACRAGCLVTIAALTCTPSPTVSPSGGAYFNENGTAELYVNWPQKRETPELNASLESYTCNITGTSSGGVDPPAVTEFRVHLCNPTRLVLGLNTSDTEWTSGYVTTGNVYKLDVAMLDNNGILCRGDSQFGVSTVIRVDLVDSRGRSVTGIDVINLNTTTAVPPGTTPLPEYNNTVYLAGGRFRFNLVFTNTTSAARVDYVKLRIVASSDAPVLRQTIYSPIFQVIFDARSIRTVQTLPRYLSPTRRYRLDFVAAARVPDSWLAARNLSHIVDTTATPRVKIELKPSFRRALPMTFTQGAAETPLVGGRATVEFKFTGADGDYTFAFAVASIGSKFVDMPPPMRVTVQTPVSLNFYSLEFRSFTSHMCNVDCTLPDYAFDIARDDTLNTTQGNIFTGALYMADRFGFPVRGEVGATITCRTVTPATRSSVDIGRGPTIVERGNIAFTVSDSGLANFSMGFLNQNRGAYSSLSLPSSGLESEFVTLSCRCSSADCPTVGLATTKQVKVLGFHITDAMKAEVDDSPVLKVPSEISSITQFDVLQFQRDLLEVLYNRSIYFMGPDNVNDTLSVLGCTVYRDFFQFADLRESVCGGTGNCSIGANRTRFPCPPSVIECLCPTVPSEIVSPALPALRAFEALQTFQTEVQLEVTINLARAPAFQAFDVGRVQAMHQHLTTVLVEALQNNPLFAKYRILGDTILITTRRAPTNLGMDTPPPLPPFTAGPIPNSTLSAAGGRSVPGATAVRALTSFGRPVLQVFVVILISIAVKVLA